MGTSKRRTTDSKSISTPTTSSKSTTDKAAIKKKKLEFEVQSEPEPASEKADEKEENYEGMDLDSLKLLMKEKKNKLEILKRHQTEKEHLINVSEKWQEAGLLAIDKLRGHIKPSPSEEEVLDSFKIPHDFFL